MRFPDAEILVMARAPVAGKAKTRLIPALGEEGAAQLHAFLVERLLTDLTSAGIAHVTLCCTPGIDHPFFYHCREAYAVRLQPQHGSDLGERLYHALANSLQQYRRAVVIGCDIPMLNSTVISEALQALEAGMDAAINPAEDGGYALMALKRVETSLFAGVEWGGEQVFSQTTLRLKTLDWHYQSLPTLWDLDRPEDLVRLQAIDLPPHLAEKIAAFTAAG